MGLNVTDPFWSSRVACSYVGRSSIWLNWSDSIWKAGFDVGTAWIVLIGPWSGFVGVEKSFIGFQGSGSSFTGLDYVFHWLLIIVYNLSKPCLITSRTHDISWYKSYLGWIKITKQDSTEEHMWEMIPLSSSTNDLLALTLLATKQKAWRFEMEWTSRLPMPRISEPKSKVNSLSSSRKNILPWYHCTWRSIYSKTRF